MLNNKKKERLSELALVLVAAMWGGAFVALKDGLNYFAPFTLMALRFFIAAVVMYAFLWKKIGKCSLQDLKDGFILGFFSFIAFGAQTIALLYTTVLKQGLFTAPYVIIVPFLVWLFYKKKPDIKIFLSAFLAMVGIALMSFEDIGTFDFNLGDGLTLFSSFIYALMIIYVDKALYRTSAVKLTFLQLPFSFLFLGVLALFTEPIPTNLSLSSWYSVLYLAIFATFLCYLLQVSAQKYTAPSRASLLMSMESLFAVLFAVLMLGETLSFIQGLGMVLMFSALVIVELAPRKKPEPRELELG